MKSKIFKLALISIAIAAGLYFSGALNLAGKAVLINFLDNKQGVAATIDNVALALPLKLSLTNVNFASAFKADCKLVEMKAIDVNLVFDRAKGYRLVPQTISLKGGTIYGRELAEHLKLRKEFQQKRRQTESPATGTGESETTGPDESESIGTDESESIGTDESESEGDSKNVDVVRRLRLSDVTLDGGTILVNLFITRKEVPVRIKHIEADFQVLGDRFIINNFSWRMGPLNPAVKNREFDISLLNDPSKIKGVPKEVRGIFILASILLGQGN